MPKTETMNEIIDKPAVEVDRLKSDPHEKVNSINTSKTWKIKSESELMLHDSASLVEAEAQSSIFLSLRHPPASSLHLPKPVLVILLELEVCPDNSI